MDNTAPDKKKIYTVTQITAAVRRALADEFAPSWVRGEVSNLVTAASGHMYFSLKDGNAQIRCAMFRGQNRKLTFQPDNGLEILVHARVDLYQPRGDLQLIVEQAELAGFGELQLKFEQLKHKLDREGLFDSGRKKPIPAWPRTVGIITSTKGAALHDTLATLKKRFAATGVIVYPTAVQGAEAPAGICRMLRTANRRREVDVLLLIRGGGSIEDLQAFNEEVVAREIAASRLPVVSGIGHEIDFTIADFASDCRTPTPTAAAVKVSPDSQALKTELRKHAESLKKQLFGKVKNLANKLDSVEAWLVHLHPLNQIYGLKQQIDGLQRQMSVSMHNILDSKKQSFVHHQMALAYRHPASRIAKLGSRLHAHCRHIHTTARSIIADKNRLAGEFEVKLKALSPYATLQRGYALVTDDHGRLVRASRRISTGETVSVKLAQGGFDATVTRTKPEKRP